MFEKKELVRQALDPPGKSLPRLPKGELFIYESFIDGLVSENLQNKKGFIPP